MTSITRTPYCTKIRYGITGAPILTADEMDGTFAPGVGVRPTLIELVYSPARDGQPARIAASVTGDWMRFGEPDPFDGQTTTHFKSGPDGWPAWLAEETRLHDPGAALAAVHAFLDEQGLAARAFELPTPAWVEAVRAASVPPAAPLPASQPSSVSESAQSPTGASGGRLGDLPSTEDPAPAETLIGSITIRSESVQLDNGECLRDLAVGDSVELRPDTGDEGLWIVAAFHGDYQEQITLQYAEVVDDCGNDPVIACKFSGTRHAHPVDLDGKVRPRPTP